MIEQNTLIEILKPEVESGYLLIKKTYSDEVSFRLTKPFMGLANGKIYLSERGKVELKVESFGTWREVEWNKASISSSILASDILAENVRYVCSPDHFNRYALNFISLGVKTVCGCKNPRTINDRIVAVDVSYPDIPRLRGCVVVRECEDLDCACWKISSHTLSTWPLMGEKAIWDYVNKWAVENRVKIPNLDNVMLDFDIGASRIEQRYTSNKAIERKKNKVSSLKGMSLEQIKREYYK
ncbi:hypothetical protein DN730_17635 [Marinomonas piezotolerans]|uniref:Uncharacterized protein n=1 Tax=Marinomonas piezotolerans TaxID=2213058 RepID=A0A370U4V5_9GAMM|nr:hypothetical protein [Marinomonas piezotolerans]RDL42768.1 hypothetical protein DN730_17635 [Marinomonas piezotolerans]